MAIIANIYIANTSNPSDDEVFGEVHISLTDATTNQPVNGNNVVVNYQKKPQRRYL